MAPPKSPAQLLRRVEGFLLLLGVGLLAVCAGARFHSVAASRLALARFDEAKTSGRKSGAPIKGTPHGRTNLDFHSWSEKRVKDYKERLATCSELPVAVLNIPRLHLRVPVFNGTDDMTLNRGVGRIIGTAKPVELGNIGIAGHRDGFFRGLKDIVPGDMISLETQDATQIYVIDQIQIVAPDDVSVLKPRDIPSLTLVTCYPFYFVGHAPKRYVVSASLSKDLQRPESITRLEEANKEESEHE